MSELSELHDQAKGCTACELYADATQTVFGAGRAGAAMVLVGEQPGDAEDRAGEPFVGPAGRLLDKALEQAGVRREDVYVTNVVKHFRFRWEGNRRIHRTPGVQHVRACLPWLQSELVAVGPRLLVTLGATAAKALLGPSFRLTQHRGELLEYNDIPLLATVHPSAVLRGPEERRKEAFDGLVADLATAGPACGWTCVRSSPGLSPNRRAAPPIGSCRKP